MNTQATISAPFLVLGNRPTVLVVDDDSNTATLLKLALEKNGARVVTALSGRQAMRQVFEHRPDIVLLDLNMPEVDGHTVCQRLRELCDIPIIVVTGLSGTDNVTRAFAVGADDYVMKPFDVPELMARIQACLRRIPKPADTDDAMVLGNGELVIDLQRHRVWVRQNEVHLTKTEFDLLVYLARNQGRVLSHAMIRSHIWGEDSLSGQDSLKQFIGTLRKKIELDLHKPEWLVSEHGVGYALVLENGRH